MNGGGGAEELERGVSRELAPSPELVDRLKGVLSDLERTARTQAEALGLPLKRALVAGSAARETFLPGNFDIDLFVLFDPEVPRESLVEWGLRLGGALLTSPEKRYAEHPYLRGSFQGFTTEVVPGYAVERSDRPKTAVDRTPFHLEYLQAHHTPSTRNEVRLLKKFMKALGVYGAEVKTGGFSGYLCELLVLDSGTLQGVLRKAAAWRVPQHLSPRSKDPVFEESAALILADPVDPRRNVAAALSRPNLALFILAAKAYVAAPRREFFFPPRPPELSVPEIPVRLGQRATRVVAVVFPVPDLVPDILYPQLRKTERALVESLTKQSFSVVGSSSAAEGSTGVILVETQESQIGPVRLHPGPTVGIPDVDRFLEKWSARPLLQGPYVTAEGRLQAESTEEVRELTARVRASLDDLASGKDLRDALAKRAQVHDVTEVGDLAPVREALQLLWGKRLPWLTW